MSLPLLAVLEWEKAGRGEGRGKGGPGPGTGGIGHIEFDYRSKVGHTPWGIDVDHIRSP